MTISKNSLPRNLLPPSSNPIPNLLGKRRINPWNSLIKMDEEKDFWNTKGLKIVFDTDLITKCCICKEQIPQDYIKIALKDYRDFCCFECFFKYSKEIKDKLGAFETEVKTWVDSHIEKITADKL